MDAENLKIRLYRALSGLTQEKFCAEIGMDAGTYAGLELGLTKPGPDKLERAARAVGVSPDFGDEVLEILDLRRRKRQRTGRATQDFAESFAEEARTLFIRTCARLLTMQPPDPRHGEASGEEYRRQAREQLPQLLALATPRERAAVVKLGAGEYHAWTLAAEAGEAALAAEDPEEATRLADLAVELAGLVEGPEGWPEAVRILALEHRAKVAQRLGKQV